MWNLRLRISQFISFWRLSRRGRLSHSARVSSSVSVLRSSIQILAMGFLCSFLLLSAFILQRPGNSYAQGSDILDLAGWVVTSTTSNGPGASPDKLIDNDLDARWESADGNFTEPLTFCHDNSCGADVTQVYTVSAYRMYGIVPVPSVNPAAWDFSYWDSVGGEYVAVHTGANLASGWQTFTLSEPVTSSRFRITVNGNQGHCCHVGVVEVELLGASYATPTPTPTPRQIISQASTPTATPTGAVISNTLPTVVPTWTPDSVCASNANPYGWGRVTPDPLWILQCGQCLHFPLTAYPTYAPDSSGGGQYNFYNRCTVVVPPSVAEVNPRGDPKSFMMPGLDLGEPECITFQEWTVSFLDPIIGIEEVGLPEVNICIYPVTFGNIVLFGYVIPVDEILGSIIGFTVLRWLFFGRA